MTGRAWVVALLVFAAGCTSDRGAKKTAESPAPKKLERAPDKFHTRFTTTKGDFVIETVREWAPRGADRFYELVTSGFYDGARLYRVRPKFIVQWGINKDPKVQELWSQLQMPDDPVKQSNRRGYVSYAMRGPSTRTTQAFINLADNAARLDGRGFAPFGRVVEGMDVVEQFYAVYGEVEPLGGSGPNPAKMEALGDEYIQRSFPRLDQITSAKVVEFKQ